MKKFNVQITRSACRTRMLEVSAENTDEAHEKASAAIGDQDFTDCDECGVEYECEVIAGRSVSYMRSTYL